jgi:hypothetical protein
MHLLLTGAPACREAGLYSQTPECCVTVKRELKRKSLSYQVPRRTRGAAYTNQPKRLCGVTAITTSFVETHPAQARLDVFFLAAAYRDVLKDCRPDVIWSATHIRWHSQNIMNMIAGCNYVRSRDKEG